jgi:hypothetical protein
MRVLIVLICVLLVACSSQPQGKGVDLKAAINQTQVSGKVIDDVFDPQHCLSDSSCAPGHECIDRKCVLKS